MKRTYENGQRDDIVFFTGIEVEKTPAFGMKTLFVTGVQDIIQIKDYIRQERCEHIFFGANHSYTPEIAEEFQDWDYMIQTFLDEGILCSLDIPSTIDMEWFMEGGLIENHNFIPQIRVVVPYIKQWPYNTMVKIDDKDFKASNPGVWCHSLHDLMDRNKFTDWSKYELDKVLE
tara:strand:- start:2095 stop:2616 length:522 start_codon:yes stop_codon:yes gene_type:complete